MDEAAIEDLFTSFGPVRCKRMFGGIGIYADGLMFGLFAFDEIYLKADPDFAGELEGEGSRPFQYEARGRTVKLGYWTLPDRALDDPEAASDLARQALRIARAAAAAKPPRRPKPPKD